MSMPGVRLRALVRLEWVERIGRELGVGRDTLRDTFGRMLVPGIPEPQDEFDGVGLLDLPASDARQLDPYLLRTKLREYTSEEAVPPAPWLQDASPRAGRRGTDRDPGQGQFEAYASGWRMR